MSQGGSRVRNAQELFSKVNNSRLLSGCALLGNVVAFAHPPSSRRKDNMTKSIVEEVKQKVKQNHKEANAMKHKTIIETAKTIVITALIAGIALFITGFLVGNNFQKEQTEELKTHVESITAAVKTSESK